MRRTGIVELVVGGIALWVFNLLFTTIAAVSDGYARTDPTNLTGVVLLLLI